ncbi:MAG: undecaprenyl-phosphate galactose phosphotransferase WbaP [Janthinobacterium lividum]
MTQFLNPAQHARKSFGTLHPVRPKSQPRRRKRTLAAMGFAMSDALAIVTSTLCAYAVMLLMVQRGWSSYQDGALTFAGLPLLGLSLLAYAKSLGRYHQRQTLSVEIWQVMTGAGLALLFNAALEFSFKTNASRVVVCGTWLAFPIVATAFRQLTKRGLDRLGLWRIPVLVVGSGTMAQRTVRTLLTDPALGYEVASQVNSSLVNNEGGREPWLSLMSQANAEFVVIALDVGEQADPTLVEALVREDVPFAVAPSLQGLPVVASGSTYLLSHDVILLFYRNSLMESAKRAVKVTFDVFVAAMLLLFMSPIFLVIMLLVRADGGPALFSHTRIGVNGRRFGCLKFRSMVVDSEARLQALLESDPAARAEWQSKQKLRSDPRITRIGKFLRQTSLDELPQLLNILRLDMSLVGPRPIVESEMVHYGQNISYYFEARPGVTGLWQVSGRSDTSYEERVRLDTWYVKNWTLWHDLTILVRTVPAVLMRHGAV